MKLQRKTLATIAMAVGAATALSAAVAYFALGYVARTFELQAALQTGAQMQRWLVQDLRQLSDLTHSHSLQPNVVSALRGADDSYVVYSLSKENIESLRLSEVWLVDTQVRGRIPLRVFATNAIDASSASPSIDHHAKWLDLALGSALKTSGTTPISQVVTEGDNVYMIAVHPVREGTLLNGPVIGALLMARQLNHKELKRFSETLMSTVGLDVNLSPSSGNVSFSALSSMRGQVLVPVPNIDGGSAAQLSITTTREIYRSITSFVFGSVAQMVFLGLVLAGVLAFVLNRFVLKRIHRIITQLKAVRLSDLREEDVIRDGGDDELTSLASSINDLLRRIRSDLTAQQQASKRHEALQLQLMQSQKMEAIGRFSGGVAHDFNNSLIGTNGLIRLAMEDLSDEHPSRELLERALKGTEYASGLVKQLMAFSRQSAPQLERIRMGEVIERTKSFAQSGLLKRTQIEIACTSHDDEVTADPTQLQQVLVNLLINASDAMDGEGRIRLTLDSLDIPTSPELPGSASLEPGRYLHVTVCDEGTGIPQENLVQIFEPFFTTKEVGRGTGLGLSVAHGVMQRHHGGIGVQSKLGEGTCFHLFLPVTN